MPVVFLEIYHLLLWPLRSWLACVRNKERDRESRTHLKYNPKNGILFCYGLKINKRYTSLLYAKSHSNFMCVSGRMQNYGNGRIYTKSHLKCAQTHQMCVWVWLCICVYNQWRLFIRFDGDADEKLNQFAIQFIFYGTWAEFCSFVRLFLQPRKIQIRHKCSDGISALSRRRRCLVPKNADAVSLLHLLCIGIGVCK